MREAVVIGGTRGIGAGVVGCLLEKGWRVTATGVSEDEVAAYDGGAATAVLDVTENGAVEAFFAGRDRLDGLF